MPNHTTPVTDLYTRYIDTRPLFVYWDVMLSQYHDILNFYSGVKCPECGKIVVVESLRHGHSAAHNEIAPDSDCDAEILVPTPMYNAAYPIDLLPLNNSPEDAAAAIADLPLCIAVTNICPEDEYPPVELPEVMLALTGAGMDMSWEICLAYMRLGYLPPLEFCNLPKLSGPPSPDKAWVIKGCFRAAAVMKGRISSIELSLRNVKDYYDHAANSPDLD